MDSKTSLHFGLILIIVLLSFCSTKNKSAVKVENKYIEIDFDDVLYSKIGNDDVILSDFSATEYIIADGEEVLKFNFDNIEKKTN